jgi:hypothetical protein
VFSVGFARDVVLNGELNCAVLRQPRGQYLRDAIQHHQGELRWAKNVMIQLLLHDDLR